MFPLFVLSLLGHSQYTISTSAAADPGAVSQEVREGRGLRDTGAGVQSLAPYSAGNREPTFGNVRHHAKRCVGDAPYGGGSARRPRGAGATREIGHPRSGNVGHPAWPLTNAPVGAWGWRRARYQGLHRRLPADGPPGLVCRLPLRLPAWGWQTGMGRPRVWPRPIGTHRRPRAGPKRSLVWTLVNDRR